MIIFIILMYPSYSLISKVGRKISRGTKQSHLYPFQTYGSTKIQKVGSLPPSPAIFAHHNLAWLFYCLLLRLPPLESHITCAVRRDKQSRYQFMAPRYQFSFAPHNKAGYRNGNGVPNVMCRRRHSTGNRQQ